MANGNDPAIDEYRRLAGGGGGASASVAELDSPQWGAYAKPGPYVTKLDSSEEQKFQGWVKQNKIPWKDEPNSDYDMRGFWKAQQQGDPNAKRAANQHFPDTYKTPYHQTFSNESKYALSTAGHWEGDKFVPPVSEDEDPAIAEFKRMGTPPTPPAAPKQDLSEAERVLKTPLPTLTDQSSRLGRLPLELPPSPLQPHAVRGQFGQPIPPLPIEQQLESEQYREAQAKTQQQEEEQRQEQMGPIGRVVAAGAKGLTEAMGRVPAKPKGPSMVDTIRQFAPVLAQPIAPLEAAISPSEKGSAASFERGVLKGVGELTSPENLALAGSMEAIPAEFATSAAGKVILGAGFTVPMAVGLMREVPEMRDAITHKDWNQVAQLAGQAIPTIAFTAEGVRNIYEGIAQGVNISKQFVRARDEFARRQAAEESRAAEARPKLAERAGEAPTVPPEPEPEPEQPPPAEKEEVAPEEPAEAPAPKPKPPKAPKTSQREVPQLDLNDEVDRLTHEANEAVRAGDGEKAFQLRQKRDALMEERSPTQDIQVVLTDKGRELSTEASEPEDELPTEPPEREVMRQPPSTSRGTSTGEAAQLPEALKADLEEQAGRPLSDEEAVAMDRANLERGMAEHGPGDTLAIREEKRAELEQPGRPELPTEAPQSEIRPSETVTHEQEQQSQEDETLAEIKKAGEKTEQLEPRAPLDLFRETYRTKLAEKLKEKAGTVGYNWRDKSPEAVSKFVDGIISQAQAAKGAATADFWKNNEVFRDTAKSLGITSPAQLRKLLTHPATSGALPAEPSALEASPYGKEPEIGDVVYMNENDQYSGYDPTKPHRAMRYLGERQGRYLMEDVDRVPGQPRAAVVRHEFSLDENVPVKRIPGHQFQGPPESGTLPTEVPTAKVKRQTTRELPDGTIVHTQEGTSYDAALKRYLEVHALERELIARGRITKADIPRLRSATMERAPRYQGQAYYEAALKRYLSEPARRGEELAPPEPESGTPPTEVPTAKVKRQRAEPEPAPETRFSPSVIEEAKRTALSRPEYDQLESSVSQESGRPEDFPSYQELLDERAKPGVEESESSRETAARLMAQGRASALEGPGTPAVGQFDPTESPLRELTKSVERVANPSDSISDRIRNSVDVARAKGRTKDAVTAAWGNVKAAAVAINDYLRRPPEQTDYKDALKDYQGGVQRSAHEIRGFIKQFRRAVPEKGMREAMGAYIEAGEDAETLKKWIKASKGDAKTVYENALKLTDEQKTIARNVHQFQEDRAQFAIEQGIMEHAVENYVMHVWDRPNKFTKAMVNLVKTRMLQPNPSFAKRRIFPTTFDGEQSGFKPKSRDLGDLAAAHEYALNEAVLARAFIRSLLDGKEKDGRPLAAVSGSGSAIPKESVNKEAYFITSHMKPEEVMDYRPIDHPALRAWKWATSDSDANPIFVKGDIVIHPDSWRQLKNILGSSALRQWEIPGTSIRPAKAALELGREFKNTLLSLSGFHQTQEGVHALEHRVNPANLVKLNLGNHDQWNLVRGGLQVASFNQQQIFSEGVAGSGLVNRIPGVGRILQAYQDYLFSDYIPRLKMTMGLHALQRNRVRYGKTLTEDQIYELTANQGNAAFGELNLTMLGRNKTFQDVMRLTLLAPDFLEARGRFVGQAAKPWGREQFIALALGALVMYAGARILNQLLDDDPHWQPQDAFNVVYKGKTYVLRTVQGDIEHLLSDPRSFVYNRLNPVYGRGAVEAITGRDRYGRKRGAADQISDLVHELVPIPAQGRLKSVPETLGETVLTSLGVSSFPYESPAEKLAKEYAMEQLPTGERSDAQVKASRKVGQMVSNIRSGKEHPEELDKAFARKEISETQYQNAKRDLTETAFESDAGKLGLKQTLDVYSKATDEEKKQLLPHVLSKVHSLAEADSDTRAELESRVNKILGETGNRAYVPSRVDDELVRLNYQGLRSVDQASKTLTYDGEKYPLSPNERLEFQQLKGKTVRGVLNEMISDPKYQQLTDGEKLSEIRSTIKDVDNFATQEMMSRIESRRLGGGVQNLPTSAPEENPETRILPMEAPQ